MATTAYTPQNGTAQRPGKFNPAQGLAEIVAIASFPGEMKSSEFGPPEVRFQLTDGRPWYVQQTTADEIGARIVPGQQFEVLRFGRNRTDLRITPLPANLGYQAPQPVAAPAVHPVAPVTPAPAQLPEQPGMTKATACMCASMCSAVDAVMETQAYAARKGLGLTFSEESVRAIGLSIYIAACREGGR